MTDHDRSNRCTSNRRIPRGSITALGLGLLFVGSTGCVEQSGDLLDTAPLPALSASSDAGTWNGSTQPSLPAADDPDAWSRADWRPVRIEIPMASTIHQPTYVGRALPTDGVTSGGRRVSPRDFPTSESALVIETDCSEVVTGAVLAPFAAALDLVASPVRLILMPPWTESAGPEGDWVLLPGVPTVEPEGSS